MSEPRLIDATSRLRPPAATPGHWAGCAPTNKGMCYPADPPTVEEIIPVMRQAGPGPYADRLRGLIAILWRAGLRISEALALTETDLDPKTGSVLVRAGKGGKRRMVGIDDWGWAHVTRGTAHRIQLPVGPLFCILAGATRGRGWSATAARGEPRRHAHAIEMAHEGIPLPIIQRQLGHAHLGITSIYPQRGLCGGASCHAVGGRVVSARAGVMDTREGASRPDFEAEGLLDGLQGEVRAARLRLLERLLDRGATLEQLRTAAAKDQLVGLSAELALGDERSYTCTGLSQDAQTRRFLAALFPGARGAPETQRAAPGIWAASANDGRWY